MKIKLNTTDPDMIGSMAAMRRAAVNAERLAEATGTPLVIMEGGKIVERYSRSKRRGKARRKTSQKKRI